MEKQEGSRYETDTLEEGRAVWLDVPYLTGCILIPCIGLALLRFWVMGLEEGGAVFDTDPSLFLASWLGRGGLPLVMVVALNAMPLTLDMARKTIPASAAATSVGGFAACIAWPNGLGFLTVAGSLVGLAGLGWLYSCWGEVYRHIRIRDVTLSTMLSLIASSLLAFALTALPPWMEAVCIVVIPPVVARLFLHFEKRGLPALEHRAAFAGFHDRQSVAVLGKLAIMLALYSAILGAIHIVSSTSPNEYGGEILYPLYLATSICLALAFIASVLARGRMPSVKGFWVAIVSTICLSFVLAVVFKDALQIVLTLFAAVRYTAFGFINIKLVDIAHHSRTPLYVVFAAGWGIIQLFMTLGATLTLYAVENLALTVDLVAIMLLAALAMGSLFLLNNAELSDVFVGSHKEAAAGSETVQDVLMRSCRQLRARHGLTEREAEVVLLIAQGHTQTYCAEALVVSINTIRSHMKHIYAKMDIHSKDELLEALAKVNDRG